MAGEGIIFLAFAVLVLLPLALLRGLFRVGRGAARLARNRRNVPLPQKTRRAPRPAVLCWWRASFLPRTASR